MDRTVVAYCGLYCDACCFRVAVRDLDGRHFMNLPEKYVWAKDMALDAEPPCPGCKAEDSQCSECKIRNCAKEKGLTNCSQCDSFPCGLIADFCGDSIPHHGAVIGNLMRLGQVGEDAWLEEQRAMWICGCGKALSWYMKKCPDCAAEQKEEGGTA